MQRNWNEMKKMILITGGQRSGKSTYAEELVLKLSNHPVYLATAHIWDDEFRHRVELHKDRRGPQWTNVEEELYLSRHDFNGRVVLLDCLTLWSTNYFFLGGEEQPVESSFEKCKEELSKLFSQDATFVVVTNEIGLGGTSSNAVQRHFTDLLGWLNQFVAQQADEVILMVSGIPVKVK